MRRYPYIKCTKALWDTIVSELAEMGLMIEDRYREFDSDFPFLVSNFGSAISNELKFGPVDSHYTNGLRYQVDSKCSFINAVKQLLSFHIDYIKPLRAKDKVRVFNRGNILYEGEVTRTPAGNYYVFFFSVHDCVCSEIFSRRLNTSDKRSFFRSNGIDAGSGVWPEAYSPEDLERQIDCINKKFDSHSPAIDYSKFRFRIGSTITLKNGSTHKIVGYYFSKGFNNYGENYGYAIDSCNYGHGADSYSYDEYGNKFPASPIRDKLYITEEAALPYTNHKKVDTLPKNNNKQSKTKGYEIRLQKTSPLISRGTVPEGSRICSRIHETAISIKPLSHTEITW